MFRNTLMLLRHFPTPVGKGTKFSRRMYEVQVCKGTKIGRQRYEVVAERTKAVAIAGRHRSNEAVGERTNRPSPCPCGRQTYEVVGKGTKPTAIERISCDPGMRTLALRYAAIAAP
jgi:hypothetical protein